MRVACHCKPSVAFGTISRSQFLRRSALAKQCAPNPVNLLILQILIQTINHVASPDNVSGLRREVAVAFRQCSASRK